MILPVPVAEARAETALLKASSHTPHQPVAYTSGLKRRLVREQVHNGSLRQNMVIKHLLQLEHKVPIARADWQQGVLCDGAGFERH